jgi:nucleotide-binding universal stress UspA family protein
VNDQKGTPTDMDSDSTPNQAGAEAASASIFDRVLCGVDGTDESRDAVSQIARLAPETSRVILCSVWNSGASVALGWSPPVTRTASFPRDEIEAAVKAVRPLLPPSLVVETSVVEGPPGPMVLTEAARHQATLVAVGSHDRKRLAGIFLGSVATQVLHEAACPVLVARPPGAERFPATVMVAADGSQASTHAIRVAAEIARRLGAELEAVVATGGTSPDIGAVRNALESAAGPDVPLREDPDTPVDALTRLEPDLLVVGSRGLHGVRALGSVSERVAHDARCSVLVVR